MGKFKDVGCPAAALMEECNEVAQVIAEFFRFDQNWESIREGQKILVGKCLRQKCLIYYINGSVFKTL